MKKFYTFILGPRYQCGRREFAVIEAEDLWTARRIITERYGNEWALLYNEDANDNNDLIEILDDKGGAS